MKDGDCMCIREDKRKKKKDKNVFYGLLQSIWAQARITSYLEQLSIASLEHPVHGIGRERHFLCGQYKRMKLAISTIELRA